MAALSCRCLGEAGQPSGPVNAVKHEEVVKAPKAAFVTVTLRDRHLIEEVLGDGLLTTHGVVD